MALAGGAGPFGLRARGEWNSGIPDPAGVLFFDDSPRWVRVRFGGEAVADSRRAKLLHRAGALPAYWFPRESLAFHNMDEWLEEDEPVAGHPRDPYHRIDVLRSSRHVKVSVGGQVVAESTNARVLHETAMPPRWYIPREENIAWTYEDPRHDGLPVKGHLAFFSDRAVIEVDGERL